MRSFIVYFVAIACIPNFAFCQLDTLNNSSTTFKSSLVKGYVQDSVSHEPLAFIHVVIQDVNIVATTDVEGLFMVNNVPIGSHTILFTSIGYMPKRITMEILADGQEFNMGIVPLTASEISLSEVVVSPGSYSIMEKVASTSSVSLSEENLKNMAFAEDITRAVSRLPGISASDYTSKFAIRGGEADEVLISLDGMELYEPFHQRDYSGGLFCIVDIEAIRGVDLMTGGFSAAYGNRLSGVFGMKSKSVMDESRHTKLGLSIMNAQLYTDGKFAMNKGSYVISARRGMLDLSLKAIGNQEWFPTYYDGFIKVEYAVRPNHILSAHFLRSGDKTYIDNDPEADVFDEFETSYNNSYGWLTLRSYFSKDLDARTILYCGNINHYRSGGYDKYEASDKGFVLLDDKRDYSYIGIKQDWSLSRFAKVHFRFGFDAKELWADYQYFSAIHELRINSNEELFMYDKELNISLKPKGEQVGSYLNVRYKILPKLVGESGIRYDFASYTNDNNISPRISLLYIMSNQTSIRAAYGYYYQSQFINAMDVNHGITEFDQAELAVHYVVGLEHNFLNGVSMRIEGYYKDYSNISPQWQNLRDHLESFPESRNDNARVIFNGITSKGIEIFLTYDKGNKISWWFSYALAQALDDIQDIEFDGLLIERTGLVPRLNDQRHTIYADINYRPTASWHFSASWHYYIGWPRTDYTYRYQEIAPDTLHFYPVHAEFNGTIYPAYHRLDLRINKSFDVSYGDITTFLQIINVYNRENLKKFDLDASSDNGAYSLDADGNYLAVEDNKYWLGFLPVFGVNWEF